MNPREMDERARERRFRAIEAKLPDLFYAEVTDNSPLSISTGGSVDYTSVKANIDAVFSPGDIVLACKRGNDVVVFFAVA